jgi:hypothetical protein
MRLGNLQGRVYIAWMRKAVSLLRKVNLANLLHSNKLTNENGKVGVPCGANTTRKFHFSG